ncbi:peptidase M48 Ste24p [Tardiphaga alba]|uniref:Protease HtpX homolog n=1 Tax=Tardiphaga alba TaxID=340268 RepID=A0ABX8A418_9BRAD|nr:M48 family metallopeptidase [Tardiphaga alba]QUS38386.1 peptidase M48 Ste24p [Tardiphaga alba]
MAAYGLYTHIASNKTRSMLLLAGLFLLIYVVVFAGALVMEVWSNSRGTLPYYLNAAFRDLLRVMPLATIAAIGWIIISYFGHQKMIDVITGSTSVTRKEQPRLYNLLENLCISRGIPMPKLKIIEDDALNAFATGLNQKQYSVTVTTGLLRSLDDDEMEAVLGHELTHIRNGDVQLMVIAGIIAGVVGLFAELLFRTFANGRYRSASRSSSQSSSSDGKGSGAVPAIIIAVVLLIVAWALSQMIRLALSRTREFMADAGAVELTKNPDAMISALRKIENRGELPGATSAVMEMCVDNPRSGFADIFATHPSVDARVAALIKFAGGHDPGPLALPGEVEEEAPALPEGEAAKTGPLSDAVPPGGAPIPGPWGKHA